MYGTVTEYRSPFHIRTGYRSEKARILGLISDDPDELYQTLGSEYQSLYIAPRVKNIIKRYDL